VKVEDEESDEAVDPQVASIPGPKPGIARRFQVQQGLEGAWISGLHGRSAGCVLRGMVSEKAGLGQPHSLGDILQARWRSDRRARLKQSLRGLAGICCLVPLGLHGPGGHALDGRRQGWDSSCVGSPRV